MSNHKFDLFPFLNELSTKNRDYVNNLSAEDIKDIQPLVIMRWLSGTSSRMQLVVINELANPLIFALHKHKSLLLRLLMTSTTGNTQRYVWHKQQKNKNVSKPASVSVIQQYFSYSLKQAVEVLPLLRPDDIISMAEDLGMQPDNIQKIRKEHNLTSKKQKEAPSKTVDEGFRF